MTLPVLVEAIFQASTVWYYSKISRLLHQQGLGTVGVGDRTVKEPLRTQYGREAGHQAGTRVVLWLDCWRQFT